jgi:hypothetical protein
MQRGGPDGFSFEEDNCPGKDREKEKNEQDNFDHEAGVSDKF